MKRLFLILLAVCLIPMSALATTDDDIAREYTFTLEGETYTLPCLMSEFNDHGWSSTSPGGTTDVRKFKPHTYGIGSIYLGDKRLDITIANNTEEVQPLAMCFLVGISVKDGDDCSPVLANGIALGASGSDVAAAYGKDLAGLAGKAFFRVSFRDTGDSMVHAAAAGKNKLYLQLDKPFDDPDAKLSRLDMECFPE